MIPLASFALAGCLAIGGGSDYIQAEDLKPAFPALAEVPDGTVVGPAPAPGAPHIFHIPELARMAARFQVTPVPEREICLERPLVPLDRARIWEAMHRQLPDARIEVADFSRQPAPR